MEADLLLCDHAEAVNGKLYINGGGWNAIFAPLRPITIFLAALITLEWNEANVRYELGAELQDEDGAIVENGEPPQPIRITAQLEVGRPPGVRPGTELVAPFALGFQNLLLPVGGYVWRLMNGEQVLARRSFQVVAPPTGLPGFPQTPFGR